MNRLTSDQEIEKRTQMIESLPFATDDELELVADLSMHALYRVWRDRGGRELNNCQSWAGVAGYRIPPEKVPAFTECCKNKWRLIIRYLETEYRY